MRDSKRENRKKREIQPKQKGKINFFFSLFLAAQAPPLFHFLINFTS